MRGTMKKVIGWILTILGGLFCLSSVMTAFVVFAVDDMTLAERVSAAIFSIVYVIVSGAVCYLGIRLKRGKSEGKKSAPEGHSSAASKGRSTLYDSVMTAARRDRKIYGEPLMTSQLAALYLKEQDETCHRRYIERLTEIGFTEADADKMFAFECDVIRRFNKQYLLDPEFTMSWFFGLEHPFFIQYPQTKEDILRERFLTVSELCKIIDEAEWHFWNSHERELPEGVWGEICEWRLKGVGGTFASRYCEMIEETTGIGTASIAMLVALQGEYLNHCKWDRLEK